MNIYQLNCIVYFFVPYHFVFFVILLRYLIMRQESYNNVPALPLDIVINILNNFVNIEPFAYRLSQFNNAALVCRTWYDASRHLIFQNLDGRTVSNLYRIDSLIQPSSSSSSLQQYQHAKHLLSTKVRRLILSFNEFRQGVFFSMDLECAWKTWQLCCARIISTCSCLEFLDIDATGSALPLTCVQLSHAISSRRRLVDFSFTISPSSHPSSHPSSQDDHHRGEQGVLMAAEKEELANENAMIESGEEETHFSPSPSILSNDNGNITSDTYNNMEIDASCRSLKNVTITIKDLLSRSDCIQNMPFCYPSSSNNKEKLAVESLTLVFDLKAPSLIRTVGAHPPSSERSIFLLRKVLGSLLDDGGNYDQLSRPQLEKLVLYHTGSGNRALFLTMVGAALTLLGGQIKSLSIHDVSWTNSLST